MRQRNSPTNMRPHWRYGWLKDNRVWMVYDVNILRFICTISAEVGHFENEYICPLVYVIGDGQYILIWLFERH